MAVPLSKSFCAAARFKWRRHPTNEKKTRQRLADAAQLHLNDDNIVSVAHALSPPCDFWSMAKLDAVLSYCACRATAVAQEMQQAVLQGDAHQFARLEALCKPLLQAAARVIE